MQTLTTTNYVCADTLPSATEQRERHLINAIMQCVVGEVESLPIEKNCHFCGQRTHRGLTSNGEPYFGCSQCTTVFLLKPMILNAIFDPNGRIMAIATLMAVEGKSYEDAADIENDTGIPRDITAIRQIHEAYTLYTPYND